MLPHGAIFPPLCNIIIPISEKSKVRKMETIFYQRLISLCEEKGVEISNVLKATGMSTSKGTAWKTGTQPKADQLIPLCRYFDVSLDYMCGESDIKQSAEKLNGLSADIVELIDLYQAAPPQLREAVKRFLTSP